MVSRDAQRPPAWVTWQRRPFPDANLLLIHGRQPALIDSGFVGHAQQNRAVRREAGFVEKERSRPSLQLFRGMKMGAGKVVSGPGPAVG
jgi:hypothetical protein